MVRVPTEALEDVARRFALLGDPTRLRVLRELHQAGESTVSALAEAAGVSVANASQHLGRLALGGVVGRRRVGRTVVYRITEPAIDQLCAIVCASLSIETESASAADEPDADVS
ncbi:winged helix-turn-helix domain-containing protein [Phycicoccus sp.]|mgnify:CR=1 FL=1|uniref:ArsR/SmtB family transcription factor n=1 Tax=Phycicoccus sp. TaxID=1902410 RepID=UPI002D0DCD3E|nr:winged helix-turn-helix domain-containing protein [Phycicoccus sp.]HMM96105.1 winged helix-turn-helix domain-containing protein [Phycicoccus sp.]